VLFRRMSLYWVSWLRLSAYLSIRYFTVEIFNNFNVRMLSKFSNEFEQILFVYFSHKNTFLHNPLFFFYDRFNYTFTSLRNKLLCLCLASYSIAWYFNTFRYWELFIRMVAKTLSIMTLVITTYSIKIRKCNTQHNDSQY
jgi:hypothetical protein